MKAPDVPAYMMLRAHMNRCQDESLHAAFGVRRCTVNLTHDGESLIPANISHDGGSLMTRISLSQADFSLMTADLSRDGESISHDGEYLL